MTSAPSRPAVPALHRERLSPGAGTILVAAATGAVFGVILIPLSVTAAAMVAIVLAAGAVLAVVLTSPVVEVDPERVVAGRAHIDPGLLGPAQVLEGEEWAHTMGAAFEPLAHHCTRGWMRAGVRVPVLDVEDPTTAWVIASRRPEELALALQDAGSR